MVAGSQLLLAQHLTSTNVIESVFTRVEMATGITSVAAEVTGQNRPPQEPTCSR